MSKIQPSAPDQSAHDPHDHPFFMNQYFNSEYISELSTRLAEIAFNARRDSLGYILRRVQNEMDVPHSTAQSPLLRAAADAEMRQIAPDPTNP